MGRKTVDTRRPPRPLIRRILVSALMAVLAAIGVLLTFYVGAYVLARATIAGVSKAAGTEVDSGKAMERLDLGMVPLEVAGIALVVTFFKQLVD